MVKASKDKGEHVLETWRILSKELDPKGLGTELVELSELITPEKLRAKNPAGISAAIESWEAMERRVTKRQETQNYRRKSVSLVFSSWCLIEWLETC